MLESKRKETTASTTSKSKTDEPRKADIELAALVVLTYKQCGSYSLLVDDVDAKKGRLGTCLVGDRLLGYP